MPCLLYTSFAAHLMRIQMQVAVLRLRQAGQGKRLERKFRVQRQKTFISRFERYMNLTLPNDLKINLFIHISAMIERLVRANPIREYNGLEEMNRLSPDFAVLFKRAFSIMAQKYGVEVNEEEIGIIYEIIKNANEAEQGGIL